jgi:hypothetical protein
MWPEMAVNPIAKVAFRLVRLGIDITAAQQSHTGTVDKRVTGGIAPALMKLP